MIALDTNVVVRLLVPDPPEQQIAARQLIETHAVMIVPTVLQEVVWVLTSRYRFSERDIAVVLRRLFGLSNVNVWNEDQAGNILSWYEAGMDFADAIHVSQANEYAKSLITFDNHLARLALRLNVPTDVVVLQTTRSDQGP